MRNSRLTHCSIFPLLLLFLGCRSAPPPAPVPVAVSMAERAEDQAAKLSKQGQNWPAVARAWQLAADRFSLLNDMGGEAVALHNRAQAERELGRSEEARKHLEAAARLNARIGRTNEWWRNQIALLQLEAQKRPEALKERFDALNRLIGQVRDPALHGLFLTELGLWQMNQNELENAEKTLSEAEQAFKVARDQFGLAAISANRAAVYEKKKNYEAALSSWRTALAGFEALAEPRSIADVLAGQGRTMLAAKEDLPMAEELLRRAARNYQLLQEPAQAKATLELLAQCLKAQGKAEEAEKVQQELK